MSGFEANFDGLVGPTHHYAGLSVGNEASQNNRDGLSNPKKAALQGLPTAGYLLWMASLTALAITLTPFAIAAGLTISVAE